MSQFSAEPKTVAGYADRIAVALRGTRDENAEIRELHFDVLQSTEAKAVIVAMTAGEPGNGGTVMLRIEDQEEFEDFAERFGANVTVLVFKD